MMEGAAQTNLHACHEGLATAVVEEANKRRPFFTRPESTTAGLPRLSPMGAELGGWATLLLLSPHASGGLARAWKVTAEGETKFAIPLPGAGGTRIRAVAPFAGVLPERVVFPSAVPGNRIAACLKSHGWLLEKHNISEAQLKALISLFVALGNHTIFEDRWVGEYTRTSLQLAAGLAWSVVLLSSPARGENLPGWVFPAELRASNMGEEKGLAVEPSGLWALPERERVVALQQVRGKGARHALKVAVSIDAAWNGSLFLMRLGGTPSGDPPADWRDVGRRLCEALRALDFGALNHVDEFMHLVPLWRRVVAKHRHTSIPHLVHTLKYRDLIRDGRWDRSILVPRLREVQAANESLPDIPLARLGPARLLAAFRMRGSPPDELNVLESIESALFKQDIGSHKPLERHSVTNLTIAERWTTIVEGIPNPRYQRRAQRKSNGGLRFLDVPHPQLAMVLRIIEKNLCPVFPPNTWACAFLPYRGPAWHAHIHAGAHLAAVVDIEDFFGSIRPRHVERWFGLSEKTDPHKTNLLPEWSEAGRQTLIDLAFATDGKGHHWLPQGAPTSPYFANLAATRVDILASVGGQRRFGDGLRYSRYADDLVLSVTEDRPDIEPDHFVRFLRKLLLGAGWTVNEAKVRQFRISDATPLVACGVEVPSVHGEGCRLTRPMRRRVRSALHHARHLDYTTDNLNESIARDRGMLSFAYSATGDPAWLAYTSRLVGEFARAAAGTVFAESLLAGMADAVDKRSVP